MICTLWICVLAVCTAQCLAISEDSTSTGHPNTITSDGETTTELENVSTTPSIEDEFLLEGIVVTTSHSIEINENSSSEVRDYIEEVLQAQNEYRELYGVPPLELNEDLNKKSQSWANHLATVNALENSFSDYAENIYVESINAERNGTSPAKFWYDKVQYYIPGKLTNDWWNAGSFTQLIWARSKYLGVGMAENSEFRFVVCFYDPPGNVIGQDPLDLDDDYPEIPQEKTFYVLPGGVFREGNENENLTTNVLKKFMEEVLGAHNQYRALHGALPLQLNEELNKESQTWADKLAETNTFHHSSSLHGENIYEEPIYLDRNGTSPVKLWYDEIQFYTFGMEPEDWSKVGHFTQLIWTDTKYLGVGISENEDTRFIVCNYDPRGNIINQSHYENFVRPINGNNSSFDEIDKYNKTSEDVFSNTTFNSALKHVLKIFNNYIESENVDANNETIDRDEQDLDQNNNVFDLQDVTNNSKLKNAILKKINEILSGVKTV